MNEQIKESIENADKLIVGIGEAFEGKGDRARACYDKLKDMLEGKDYYIISLCSDGEIEKTGLDKNRLVTPLDENDDKWNEYNNWLGHTLNRSLCLLELGVGLKYPGVIRWPFEKIVFINKKAKMYRIHKSLYQTTEEMGDKCQGIEADPLEYIAQI